VLRLIKKPNVSRWSLRLAGLLLSAVSLIGQGARSEAMVRIVGIGLVPAKTVLACEQATGDGGRESFADAEWDYFSDCVNDELFRRRTK
jgi:hypothetical protein